MTPNQEDMVSFLYQHILSIRNENATWNGTNVHNAVNRYPAITENGINTWRKIHYYRKCHRISLRAGAILDGENVTWHDVHYEHLEPISYTKSQLFALINAENFIVDDVINIMANCEVIIISLQEKNILDGRSNIMYLLGEGEELGLNMRDNCSAAARLNGLMHLNAGFGFDIRYVNHNLFNV
jgi:hypothetical protein